MHRNGQNQFGDASDGSAPSEAWLFLQAVLGKPIPRIINPETKAKAERAELERLAQFSSSHAEALSRLQAADANARDERECLEWAAKVSTDSEKKLRALEQREAAERDAWRRAEQYAERLREGTYDPEKHPRGGFSQNRGWWSPTGSSGPPESASKISTPFHSTAYHSSHATVHLAAAGAGTWPATGTASSWLPKVGSGAFTGVGTAAGVVAGSLLAGLPNANMAPYWGRVPGNQAMPGSWAYELEKRVRAGTLPYADAVGIFNTAILGAQAQGFKPTGNTMSAVHKSTVDFMDKAEVVYFARKKKKAAPAPASLPGAYQQSGGRVFPTKRNSGLDGYALRQEQEKFFERGLSEGKLPGVLRGQAAEAGSKRAGGTGRSDDRIVDPEAEAALQRALRKTNK